MSFSPDTATLAPPQPSGPLDFGLPQPDADTAAPSQTSLNSPPLIGDPEKVRAVLLPWAQKQSKFAQEQCRTFHEGLNAAAIAFKGRQQAQNKEAAKDQLNDAIEIEPHKGRIISNLAVMNRNVQQAGRFFRVEPINGEIRERAEATSAVMDAMLDECKFDSEADKLIFRYNIYDMAGMKVFIDFCEATEPQRYYVPSDQAPSHIADLEGMGMQYDVLSSNPRTGTLFELQIPGDKLRVGAKAINMRNIAFSDPKVPSFQEQYSIHEYEIYSEDALEANEIFYIGTPERWTRLGPPNANNRHAPQTATETPPQGTSNQIITSPDLDHWEVTATHVEIPWRRWLRKLKFSEADLLAYIQEMRGETATIDDCMKPQKWIFYHVEDRLDLKLDPTYMPDKLQHCFFTESAIPGDNELVGQSIQRQMLGLSNGMNAAAERGQKNAKLRGGTTAFIDTNADLDQKKYSQAIQKDSQLIDMEFPGGRTAREAMLFLAEVIPDTFAINMNWYNMLRAELEDAGPPAIIRGDTSGASRTATQDIQFASSGQAKIDYPFSRLVKNVILPVLEAIRELIFAHFDGPMIVSIAGQSGAKFMSYKPVTRDQITNRFKIIPLATLDFANRDAKANRLLAALNIMAGAAAPPPLLLKWAAKYLELENFDVYETANLTDNFGNGSTPEDEINTLLYNPDDRPQDRLNEKTDPYTRLQMLGGLLGDPQNGIPPRDPQKAALLNRNANTQEYFQKCIDIMQYLEAQQTGQIAPPSPHGMPPKGPPRQPGEMPQSKIGETRQTAQGNSPADNGGNRTGLTGRAMVAATSSPA